MTSPQTYNHRSILTGQNPGVWQSAYIYDSVCNRSVSLKHRGKNEAKLTEQLPSVAMEILGGPRTVVSRGLPALGNRDDSTCADNNVLLQKRQRRKKNLA